MQQSENIVLKSLDIFIPAKGVKEALPLEKILYRVYSILPVIKAYFLSGKWIIVVLFYMHWSFAYAFDTLLGPEQYKY